MSLACEYLPATGLARAELVLLHGWGCNREIWRPLLARIRHWANVTLVDLPGCAPGVPGQALDTVLGGIAACCPRRVVCVGWSLGGQLAIEMARRYPDRVTGLVTVCTSPRFVAASNWPGMDSKTFADFRSGVEANPALALGRFGAIQVSGARDPRALLRQLRQLSGGSASEDLRVGLDWLESLDQRRALRDIDQPQLHLLGAQDQLVPCELGELIADSCGEGGAALEVRLLEHCGHVAPLEDPGGLAAALQAFVGAVNQESVEALPPGVAKDDIAASFSRAAADYDSAAHLQRDVGKQLLSTLDTYSLDPCTVLDLGCGTGYFREALQSRYPKATYVGLDLARGMVDYARAQGGRDCAWMVGDAEALPLASASVDLVFSSLAVQWCEQPRHLFAELARVLTPGGVCVFTSLGPGTLQELREAWSAADSHQHVNTFLSPTVLEASAVNLPGVTLGLGQQGFVLRYARVRDLLAELKAIGAHNMNRGRPAGLASRRALQGMLAAYESRRSEGTLPATYDVIFGTLEKA